MIYLLFVFFWLISLIMLTIGIYNLIIGLTYKEKKKILISLISYGLSITLYYSPYYILIETIF